MNKKQIISVISALLLIISLSCTREKKPEKISIYLIETSDIHGAIFDYDFIINRNSNTSLSKISSYIKDLKAIENVVLLDNGDILQGQPVVYYSNYENVEEEHICSQVMNYMEYDAATVGNHDIEAGHAVYDKLMNEFNFPWLAANAIHTKTGKPYFEPYTIIHKEGIKIAVLGLITPGIPKWLPEELWEGIEFIDMVESAKEWVPKIMEKEKPDLLIGLFHSGYDYTYGGVNYDTPRNENASVIVAQQVPGFDIIFVGHDHRTWNEKIENVNGDEVIIMGPKGYANQFCVAKAEMILNDQNEYDKSFQTEIIDVSHLETDKDFSQKFKDQISEVKKYVSHEVGVFEKTVDAHEAIYGPSEFVDLINTIQLDISDAEISFAAPLSFNATLDKGPVYVRDMFKLYRFENFLYTMKLSGKEIDGYLEYSFAHWFNTMESSDDHLLLFKTDDKGNPLYSEQHQSVSLKNNYYNFDVAAGIKYTVDISKPAGDKVTIHSLTSGDEFYTDSIYCVAINSYRGNGGGGHLVKGAGIPEDKLNERRINSTDKDIRYYMMNWIEEQQILHPEARKEWTVYPEDWWEKAKKKDYELLN
ncbi:MAG: bifunctional metallophosphatase/5'-nucleotidase [Bacteroidales bacterium]|jgi:2',3'-cyclic-nucleotide 2'-phosphodiesterase/3'-nucleotidase|nr:bifunctional metallophosphatase/5'-nucleotidase [Bacteroidales bacterium]